MPHFASLTEHEQLVFWTELLVILVLARVFGGLLRRIGQPAVVGELLAGLVLGPSVLGKAWPAGFGWLFPADKVQSGAVNALGWLGIAFLLVLTGFETDLGIIRRLGRAAGSVAVGALALPLACGLAIGTALPKLFVGAHAHRSVFVLFMGVALSISSLPVIAKILGDLGFMRRNFGQVTVAVGMVNDLVGWLALGVIAGLAKSSGFSVTHLGITLVAIVGLLVGGLTLGQWAIDRALRQVRTRSEHVTDSLVAVVLIVLAVATVAQLADVEAVLGAYIAGIVLGRSRFRHDEVHRHLESVTYGVLAPIFFATAGLKLDLASLGKPQAAEWGALVLAVAVFTKFFGAYLGGRVARLPNREALALGSALNARGAVEVVIATVGLSLGVLSSTAFTAIVLMAIVTSVMAPPLLRLTVRNWAGTDEEQQRLQQEEQLERNLLVRTKRLLLPSRGRPNSIVAAQVMHLVWPPEVGVTVLSVHDPDDEPDLEPIRTVFEDRDVDFRHVADDDAMATVLAESRLGYQAIGLGAADADSGRLLSPVVDELLVDSPIPLVIVRRAKNQATATPAVFERALVPVSGTPSSRVAQELAFNMASRLGTEVVLTHVVNRPESSAAGSGAGVSEARMSSARDGSPVADGAAGVQTLPLHAAEAATEAGDAVVAEAASLAAELGVEPRGLVRHGSSTGEEIVAAARDVDADLIVLGATVRRSQGRPFLGHNVELVLNLAETTVVVVTLPDVTSARPEKPAAG